MSEKLCACGHAMESRVTGKKIELHTADTGSLWSEFLAADLTSVPGAAAWRFSSRRRRAKCVFARFATAR